MTLRSDIQAEGSRMTPFTRLDLIDRVDLTAAEAELVPESWLTIAELDGPAAIEAALQLWEAALPGRFPGTVAYLRDRGLDVFLGRVHPGLDSDSDIVLVYAANDAATPKIPFVLYFGYLPASPDRRPPCWPLFTEAHGRFHTGVHNGFRTRSGGLLRIEDLRPISADPVQPGESEYEYVDENLDELPEDRRPSLDDLVVTVRDGRRGVALDISTDAFDPWAISELIEPSHLDTWSAMDDQLLGTMTYDHPRFVELGYTKF